LTEDLPGTDKPTVSVAIDSFGRYYYDNQLVQERQLAFSLHQAAMASAEPLTLVMYADRAVTTEMLIRLSLLARSAGITNGLLATLSRQTPVRASKTVK